MRLLLLPGEFEDIKVVLILRQTTQWPKAKGINNNLQNTTEKTKDRATRTPLKTRMNPYVLYL